MESTALSSSSLVSSQPLSHYNDNRVPESTKHTVKSSSLVGISGPSSSTCTGGVPSTKNMDNISDGPNRTLIAPYSQGPSSIASSDSFGSLLSPSVPILSANPIPITAVAVSKTTNQPSSSSITKDVTSSTNTVYPVPLSSSSSSPSSPYHSKDGNGSVHLSSPNHTTAQPSNSGTNQHLNNNSNSNSQCTNSASRLVISTPKTEFVRFPMPGDTNFSSKLGSSGTINGSYALNSSRSTPSAVNITPLRITPTPVVSNIIPSFTTTGTTTTNNNNNGRMISPPQISNRVPNLAVTPNQVYTHNPSLLDTIKMPTHVHNHPHNTDSAATTSSLGKENSRTFLSSSESGGDKNKNNNLDDDDDSMHSDEPIREGINMDDDDKNKNTNDKDYDHRFPLSNRRGGQHTTTEGIVSTTTTVPQFPVVDETSSFFVSLQHNNATNMSMLMGVHDEHSLGPFSSSASILIGPSSSSSSSSSSTTTNLTTFSSLFTSHNADGLSKRNPKLPTVSSSTSDTNNNPLYTDTMHAINNTNTDTRLSFFIPTNTMFPDSNAINAIPLHQVLETNNTTTNNNNNISHTEHPLPLPSSSSSSSSSSSVMMMMDTLENSNLQFPIRMPSASSFTSESSTVSSNGSTTDLLFPSSRIDSLNPLAIRPPSTESTESISFLPSRIVSTTTPLPTPHLVTDVNRTTPVPVPSSLSSSKPKSTTVNNKFIREAKALGLYVNPNNHDLPHTLLMMEPTSSSSSLSVSDTVNDGTNVPGGGRLSSLLPIMDPSAIMTVPRNNSAASMVSSMSSAPPLLGPGASLAFASLMCPPKRECVRKRERENDKTPKFQQFSRNLQLEQQKQQQQSQPNTIVPEPTPIKSLPKKITKERGKVLSHPLPVTEESTVSTVKAPTNDTVQSKADEPPPKKKKLILRTTDVSSTSNATSSSSASLMNVSDGLLPIPPTPIPLANESTSPIPYTLVNQPEETEEKKEEEKKENGDKGNQTSLSPTVPLSSMGTDNASTIHTSFMAERSSSVSFTTAPTLPLPLPVLPYASAPLPRYILLRPHKSSLRTFITRVYGEDKSEFLVPFCGEQNKETAIPSTLINVLKDARAHWLIAMEKMKASLQAQKNSSTNNASLSSSGGVIDETEILFLLHCAQDHHNHSTTTDTVTLASSVESRLVAIPTVLSSPSSLSSSLPDTALASPNLVLVSGTTYNYLVARYLSKEDYLLKTKFPSSLLSNVPWPINAVRGNFVNTASTVIDSTVLNDSNIGKPSTLNKDSSKLRATVEARIMMDIPVQDLYYSGALGTLVSTSSDPTITSSVSTTTEPSTLANTIILYYDFFPLPRSVSTIEPVPIDPTVKCTVEQPSTLVSSLVSSSVRLGSSRSDDDQQKQQRQLNVLHALLGAIDTTSIFPSNFPSNNNVRNDNTTEVTTPLVSSSILSSLPVAFIEQLRTLSDRAIMEARNIANTFRNTNDHETNQPTNSHSSSRGSSSSPNVGDSNNKVFIKNGNTDTAINHERNQENYLQHNSMIPPQIKRRITPLVYNEKG